jgi:hypothetical protein
MYIIYKMLKSRKRNRSSSSSTSSTSAYNKIMATEGAQHNKIIDDLKLRDSPEGLQYIKNNNLQEWLENQIGSETEMTTEQLWQIFYQNNIYKEPNTIEKGNLNSGLPVTIRGGQSVLKKRKNITQKI